MSATNDADEMSTPRRLGTIGTEIHLKINQLEFYCQPTIIGQRVSEVQQLIRELNELGVEQVNRFRDYGDREWIHDLMHTQRRLELAVNNAVRVLRRNTHPYGFWARVKMVFTGVPNV